MVEQRDQPSTVQVVAAAGAIAAVVASLVLAISRRPARAVMSVSQIDKEETEMTGSEASATEKLAEAAPLVRDAARIGWRRFERMMDSGREQAARAIVARDIEQAKHQALTAVELGSQRGHETVERARQQARHVGEHTTSAAQAIAAQAAAAAVARAEQAFERGASLADVAIDRVPDVTRRLSDEVMPAVREAAQHAAMTALEMWQTARERAAEAAPHPNGARLVRPAVQAAHLAATGTEKARETSAAVVERAGERAAAIGERARDVSRRGAEKTATTSRDTGALLFWAGAAVGLIAFVLFSQERRAAVLNAARGVTTELQALIQDFQGYDDEF